MYVWVDALTNYLTGTGWPDPDAPNARFWPMDVHMIGKDITRFHCIFWPAFLMSAGIPLPKQVVVHGFLFNKGEKMSKSVGNVITPASLADTYGADQIRYFFLREVPFGQDGNYTHEAIVNRINADLANDLGNLAQRSLSMIAKNCEGRAPEPGELTAADLALLADARALPAAVRAAMDQFAIPPCARHDLEGGGRCQPLFRRRGALGQEEDRPGPHGDGAAGDRRGGAHRRGPGAAVHASRDGQDAGRARRGAAGSQLRRDRRGIRAARGRRSAAACPGLPALGRERGDRLRSMIIDSHCHLDFPDFAPERDAVVARARAAGLARIITISTRVDKYEQVRAVAEAYDDVFFTVGTHPHEAHQDPEVAAEHIVELAGHAKCVGIGEAGLDYHYDRAPRDVAARVFRTHIAAARIAGPASTSPQISA